MLPQGAIFLALPQLGTVLLGFLGPQRLSGWCGSPRKLPWCPGHKALLLVWTVIYFVVGYASYLVWKDLGGGFRRPLALPFGLYAAQLATSWVVLILFFAAHAPGLVRRMESEVVAGEAARPRDREHSGSIKGGQVSGGLTSLSSCGEPRPQDLDSWGPGCRREDGREPGSRPAALTALRPAQALLHLLLLYGLVVSTALIWHPINKLAALLLLPYLAWLTVTASITYRLWRHSLCPQHQPPPPPAGEEGD
ncbi:translocator protein 2 isoform X1 [Saccopteryx bilineata]|uniref:translocator protein 2 isoform X1 n=1 Tax=Saccopteryx bilineata TaxID=59482 RepID=UPI00338EA03B